jgi:hypothetical protein
MPRKPGRAAPSAGPGSAPRAWCARLRATRCLDSVGDVPPTPGRSRAALLLMTGAAVVAVPAGRRPPRGRPRSARRRATVSACPWSGLVLPCQGQSGSKLCTIRSNVRTPAGPRPRCSERRPAREPRSGAEAAHPSTRTQTCRWCPCSSCPRRGPSEHLVSWVEPPCGVGVDPRLGGRCGAPRAGSPPRAVSFWDSPASRDKREIAQSRASEHWEHHDVMVLWLVGLPGPEVAPSSSG